MKNLPTDAAVGVDAEKRQGRRDHRYRQLAMLHRFARHELDAEANGNWQELTWRRTSGCGRSVITDDGLVSIRSTATDDGPVAYTEGVMRCGSVWLCPLCSATIKTHRQMELNAAALAHTANGGKIGMLSLTMRHHKGDPLAVLQDALSGAWRSLQQSEQWRYYRSQMVGTIVAKEVTWGHNGWHPHLHILILWKPGTDHQRLTKGMQKWGTGAWSRRVKNRFGKAPTWRGFHVKTIGGDGASYVAKIAAETVRGDHKTGDAFGLILYGLEHGEAWAVHRWREWVATMPGRRMLVWSAGLRAELLPEIEDLDDDGVINLDRGGSEVGTVTRTEYRALIKPPHGGTPRLCEFLREVERTGTARGLGPARNGIHGPPLPQVERVHRVAASRRR